MTILLEISLLLGIAGKLEFLDLCNVNNNMIFFFST